jgi:radical SAM enzyme (TIGR01210 family)
VLRKATRLLGGERPPVPPSLPYTLGYEETDGGLFARFWFRTRGCTHSLGGGCTMCDYWISTDVDADETRSSVERVLAELREKRPIDLLIETSGSFFDDHEVKPELRAWMLERFRELSLRYVIIETRTDLRATDSLEACVEAIQPSKLIVEFGVESLDPWVLKHCINKDTRPGSVREAVDSVHRSHALATANVLIGAPFLSLAEQIEDSTQTLTGVLGMGFDTAVLFPVNVKHYTLTGWLRDREMYQAPPLWALVDVLNSLGTRLLPRVVISWHRPRPDYHPGYTTRYLRPETCPNCYQPLTTLLDEWRRSIDRPALLARINSIRCACRDQHEANKRLPNQPLVERLRAQQRRIIDELLDGSWGADYLEAIPERESAGT